MNSAATAFKFDFDVSEMADSARDATDFLKSIAHGRVSVLVGVDTQDIGAVPCVHIPYLGKIVRRLVYSSCGQFRMR